jgi:N-acetylated-alpha-linked acidic dipeptidase
MTRTTICLLLWAVLQGAPAEGPIRGFDTAAAQRQRALEQKARAIPESSRLRNYMERMTQRPHVAGSRESKAVAQYAAGLMKEWGLDVRIEEYEALLPYPTSRKLEMVAPSKFRATLREPAAEGDPQSGDRGHIPTFNAYSASGSVTAPLVYVNYGVPEDYEQLKQLGIDVKGKVVIARYGKSWRGTKPKVAQEHGALGCLIYSDPRDDGYFQGDVYPKGSFRPAGGVQRGSVMDMPLYVGDPLTPGWASEKGARKLSRDEAKSILRIPVLPISYEDAAPLLSSLEGPVAPEPWRGALPITYHIGPGETTVHLSVDFDWTSKPLYNVIATIPGSESPDEWIIYGNHHDAWNNGASDPVSGAAVVLETARSFAELMKAGWRPKRTIKLALWDAEEFGLVGSTEWVEKHLDELREKAVLYINSDSTGKGTLNAGGSPALDVFFSEVLRDVQHPNGKQTVLENRPVRDGKPAPFQLGPLGAGSDYVAFIHHAGIASINAGFGGGDPAGLYHSAYDTFHYYTHFSDGDFTYGRALAEVMVTALLRMAEAPVLPFEFKTVAQRIEEWMKDLKDVDLTPVKTELEHVRKAAEAYEQKFGATQSPHKRVNGVLIRTERTLLAPDGLMGRPWYKHQLTAPGMYTGYGAKTLPGISDSPNAEAGMKSLADALRRYAQIIEEATQQF